MISKSSLVRQIQHNFVRRIWCFALLMLGFFLSLPLFITGRISQLEYTSLYMAKNGNLIRDFVQYDAFTPNGNFYCTIMVVIAAIICGFSSFCYLNSKSQVDLYHSMPMGRKKLFAVRYLSGYFLFLFSFLINLLFAALAVILRGEGMTGSVKYVFQLFAFENIYFLAIYTLVCLAVILTGNAINNIIMIICFLFGEILINVVYESLAGMFFVTYVARSSKNVYVTPLHHLYNQIYNKGYDYNIEIYRSFFSLKGGFYTLLLWTVAVLVLTLLVFMKRPSEKSGKAVVISQAELVLKAVLTTGFTYLTAFFSMEIFSAYSFGWFLFGGLMGFLLSHILLEILFRGDFRAGFKHLWHWAVDAILVLVVFGCFFLDLFHYDTYIPKKEDIAYASVSVTELDGQLDYMQLNRVLGYEYNYSNGTNYRLEHMKLTDVTKLYELVQLGIASEKKINPWDEEQRNVSDSYYDLVYGMEKEDILQALEDISNDPTSWLREEKTIDFYVRFTLKNGKQVDRLYSVDAKNEKVLSLIGALYDQPAFKLGEYPVLQSDEETKGYLNSITVQTNTLMYNQMINQSQAKNLFAAYCEELSKLSFEEVLNEKAVGMIGFEYKISVGEDETSGYYYSSEYGYPLYPSFVKTIECLKELGIYVYGNRDQMEVTDIKISTTYYNFGDGYNYTFPTVEYDATDWNLVQELIEAGDWSYDVLSIKPQQLMLDIEIGYYNKENGESYTNYGYFQPDKIPEYVLKDLMEKIEEQ